MQAGPSRWTQIRKKRVDVDCSMELPTKVLAQRRKAGFDFFANLYYEFIPHFCHSCRTLGHKTEACRAGRQPQDEDPQRLNSSATTGRAVTSTQQQVQQQVQPQNPQALTNNMLPQNINAVNQPQMSTKENSPTVKSSNTTGSWAR